MTLLYYTLRLQVSVYHRQRMCLAARAHHKKAITDACGDQYEASADR